MTETNTPANGPEGDEGNAPGVEGDPTSEKPNEDGQKPAEKPDKGRGEGAEAAKYRRQLRDTEAKLTAAEERLSAYRRQEAERAVADILDVPADLFDVGGTDLATLYDEEGNFDEGAAQRIARDIAEKRPALAKKGLFGIPGGGWSAIMGTQGGEPITANAPATWSGAFRVAQGGNA